MRTLLHKTSAIFSNKASVLLARQPSQCFTQALSNFCALGRDLACPSFTYGSILVSIVAFSSPPPHAFDLLHTLLGVFGRHKERICSNGSWDHNACCTLFHLTVASLWNLMCNLWCACQVCYLKWAFQLLKLHLHAFEFYRNVDVAGSSIWARMCLPTKYLLKFT